MLMHNCLYNDREKHLNNKLKYLLYKIEKKDLKFEILQHNHILQFVAKVFFSILCSKGNKLFQMSKNLVCFLLTEKLQ